ncbi:MAG: hypothetical protein UR28_C0003G0009 [Candidatus Peregrinibacteria bacterium GW2011_GWF2_33_10]|nr:MAG: hypothetical protein UR28_C0003G0009 [Candidatus Peregrinibacteria bacterium GW2011_GWF2_33_10]OGJ44034.1 MAG: hypothetical protein A2272_01300 [Candidatus Peregrinibacteria bacterium RIFOXYA12_FULL_33_12]OGJ44164.1 MAG: hypothetical protein A2263_04270 [Candidatus Peregrinibacteria bacterium RIFOXYA2_FULL_33_21]OGJ51793.1 MAG: hypothetical protein A2307_04935 [Candidatus Peregrinibacteria bacterium RIFOXYB2_FULL_33_20]
MALKLHNSDAIKIWDEYYDRQGPIARNLFLTLTLIVSTIVGIRACIVNELADGQTSSEVCVKEFKLTGKDQDQLLIATDKGAFQTTNLSMLAGNTSTPQLYNNLVLGGGVDHIFEITATQEYLIGLSGNGKQCSEE